MNPNSLLVAIFLPYSAVASPLLYEPFNYSSGGLNGDGGWTAGENVSVAPGSLTMPSPLSPGLGNSAEIMVGTPATLALPSAISNGTVFVSYAFKINQPFSTGIIKYKQTLSFGPSIYVVPTATNSYQLAINKASSGTIGVGTNQFWVTGNDTVFVVASYTFNAGAANDTCNLWVNPDPSSFGAGVSPTPGVLNYGVGFEDLQSISSLLLTPPAGGGIPDFLVDEIRMGTTWADVTPVVVPEPASAAFCLAGFVALLTSKARRQKCFLGISQSGL